MSESRAERHNLKIEIAENGFAVVEHCISDTAIQNLILVLGEIHGQRNLLNLPEIRELARSQPVRNLMTALLGPSARAVKGTFLQQNSAIKLEGGLAPGPHIERSHMHSSPWRRSADESAPASRLLSVFRTLESSGRPPGILGCESPCRSRLVHYGVAISERDD
jgi:hypothetical protein